MPSSPDSRKVDSMFNSTNAYIISSTADYSFVKSLLAILYNITSTVIHVLVVTVVVIVRRNRKLLSNI